MTAAKQQSDLASVSPEPVSGISKLAPYVQGKSQVDGCANPIKLSSNESHLGPSPKAIEAYNEAAKSLFRYPNGSQADLIGAIAQTFDLDPSKLICGNGSDELISLITRAYVAPGDEVIVSEYSFAMASIHAISQGATVVTAPEPELCVSVDHILERVTNLTRLVVIANPNNPVGQYISRAEIERLHQGLPSHVLLLLDGAYADYIVDPEFEAGESLVEKADNVVMTRTFSKLYGLAALRIGWAYCPEAVIDSLQRIRTPFNTNAAALAAAEAAVLDIEHTTMVRDHNNAWLKKIADTLNAAGLTVIPSATNFYLVQFPSSSEKSSQAAWDFLLAKGIIPRPVNAGGPENCLRITIGLDEENQAVIDALTEFVNT